MRKAHNKLTQEQVIAQFIEVHGDAFDYSKVVYVNTHTPVEVYCKKHDFTFFPTPKEHKKGTKCTHCGRESQIEKAKKPKEKFIEEFKKLYGDKFDTSKVEYINTKTEVIIICKEHGEFKRKPCDLIEGKCCNKCKLFKSKYNNKELFIKESIKIFGDNTDYSFVTDISATTKVDLICTKHNHMFNVSVQNRLSGQKCPKCSAEGYREKRATPKEEYYRRVNEVHNNKYTYNGDYITSKHAITFFCPEHGRQRRNSYDHLRGAGCKHCDTHGQKTDKVTRFGYVKLAKGRPTYLYLIKCHNEMEEFYKIGKTFRKITERFISSTMPYKFEVMLMHEGDAGYIWDLEEELHEKYKIFSYKPKQWFAGFTECYLTTLPIDELEELNKNNE